MYFSFFLLYKCPRRTTQWLLCHFPPYIRCSHLFSYLFCQWLWLTRIHSHQVHRNALVTTKQKMCTILHGSPRLAPIPSQNVVCGSAHIEPSCRNLKKIWLILLLVRGHRDVAVITSILLSMNLFDSWPILFASCIRIISLLSYFLLSSRPALSNSLPGRYFFLLTQSWLLF